MTSCRPSSLRVLLHRVMMQCCNTVQRQTDQNTDRTPGTPHRSVLPSLLRKPSYRWPKIRPLEFSGLEAPSPPGTEGYLESGGHREPQIQTFDPASSLADSQTCCPLHTGQPSAYVVAGFSKGGLQNGSAEDGRAPPDLRVPMGNEVQNVTDVLLVCKGTDPKSRGSSTEKHFNLCEFAN